MFPIFDVRGRVVAFGGRILGDGQPKYLNSSDTPVFQKGRTVYGLNFIKGSPKRLYLVEGYMDVVSLRQHGVEGCVASLGTALTPDQAKMMKRKAGDNGEIVIVYDGDSAGIRAAKRAIDIFAMNGVDCKVARIPGGQDPDDFVRENGGQAFENLPLQQSREYLLALEKERFDLSSLEGRTAYATAAAKIVRTLDSPVVVENYVKTLAVETGFSKEVLYEQIGRTPKVRLSAQAAGNTRNQYRDTIKDTEPPDHVKAQQRLLSLIAAGYEHKSLPIGLEDFTDPLCREMAGEILAGNADGMTASRMLDAVEDDLKRRRMLQVLSLEENIEPERTEELIESYVRTIRRNALEERSRELAEAIGNPANSASVALQLLREQMEITRQLSRLDTYFRQLRP